MKFKNCLLLIFGASASAMSAQIETPTMGWSSWNTYLINISDELIKSQADAMVKSGLKDAGFKYINIDDGYFGGRDPETGELLIHPTRFPGGMKPVVDHIHSLGLKAGIYSDAGANTCGNLYNNDTIATNVGFYGHERQDAEFFFNTLGFDFIKVDFCGAQSIGNRQHRCYEPQERYTAISNAIKATGRDDVRLNVCRWDYPGTWISDVATSWRISQDIQNSWNSVKNIIGQSLYLSPFAGGGHYNDMDMLEVGRSMTPEEDRTHFGMWCIMASPLLIGCDMTTLKPETLELLTNKEVIALNQDPLGLQAYVAKRDGDTYVLVKDIEELNGNVRAIALYNPTDEPRELSIDFADIQLGGDVKVRDLFAHKDLGGKRGSFSQTIPAHGLGLYRLEADERLMRDLYEAETAFLTSYQELYNAKAIGTPTHEQDGRCSGGVKVTRIGHRASNDIQWRDVVVPEDGDYRLSFRYMANDKVRLYVQTNDGEARQLQIEPSGEFVTTEVVMPLRKGVNVVRLFNEYQWLPDLDYMKVGRI